MASLYDLFVQLCTCNLRGDYEPIPEQKDGRAAEEPSIVTEQPAPALKMRRFRYIDLDVQDLAEEAVVALVERGDNSYLTLIDTQLSYPDVHCTEWAKDISFCIFSFLGEAIKPGKPIHTKVWDTYKKACRRTLAKWHDLDLHTQIEVLVVALGVLLIKAPWVVDVLGFTEHGLVPNTYAADWHGTYGGVVKGDDLMQWLVAFGGDYGSSEPYKWDRAFERQLEAEAEAKAEA